MTEPTIRDYSTEPVLTTADLSPREIEDRYQADLIEKSGSQLSDADLDAQILLQDELNAKRDAGLIPLEWQPPESLITEMERTEYPLESLPQIIQNAVIEVVGYDQAPTALVAQSALAALSIAGQALIDVKRSGTLSGPTSLYQLIIAESGERKSRVDSHFMAVIKEYQRSEKLRLAPAMERYESDKFVHDTTVTGLNDSLRSAVRNGEDDTSHLEKKIRETRAAEPRPPRIPHIIYQIATGEAIIKGLNEYPVGAVATSEGGILLGGHSMRTENISKTCGLFNLLWESGGIDDSTISRGRISIDSARLSMSIQVQEAPMIAFNEGSNGVARGTGWFARFLISRPESTQGFRPFIEAPDVWHNLELFNDRIRELLEMPINIDLVSGAITTNMIEMDADGKAVWTVFYNETEKEIRPFGELLDIKDVVSKCADNVARLAALFHLVEYGATGAIGAESVKSACEIVDWHLTESLRFFHELATPEEQINTDKLSKWIIDYCIDRKTDRVARRDIQMNITPARLRKKAALDEALGDLVEHHHIQVIKEGRKVIVYLNPELLDRSK